MSQKAFIALLRNDIPAGLLQYNDVTPNTSQRNSSIDPVGQTGYVRSENLVQNTAITALATSDPDGAGGDTHDSTAADEFGLQAYLRERVHVNPGGDDDSMTIAEAATVADAIVARMAAGDSLTLADINTILNANLTGADNDLEGTIGDSFGTLEDVLRILAGQVYLTPANTVIFTQGAPGNFTALADRITAIDTNTDNFFAQGRFLSATDAAYREFRQLYPSGALRASCQEGQLSKLAASTYSFINPSFSYGGVAVPGKTAAQDVTGTDIPASGVAPAVTVFDSDGNILS